MNVFKTELTHALISWALIVGIVGICAAALIGVLDQMLPVFQGTYTETGLSEGFTIQLTFSALSSNIVFLVLPILCALPFTSAFLDEYKSRFVIPYLPRTDRKDYVRSKVFATALSGGIVLFIGVMVTIVIFTLMFLPMEVTKEITTTPGVETQLIEAGGMDSVAAQQNFALLMQYALLFFLSGCLWSLVGGLMATVTMSKYMAYASPFILYYVLVILSERYFTDVYVINPREWVAPVSGWVGGVWGAALLVGELILLTGFAYAKIIDRRLEDV